MKIDLTDINTIAALAGIIGILPLIYASIKYFRNKIVKPIKFKLEEGLIMRGNGDDFLTLRAQLSTNGNNGKDLTIHKLYPLLKVAGELRSINEVLINGNKLNKDGSTNMYQGIDINKDKTYLISFRDIYDIDLNSEFKKNLCLNIEYSIKGKSFKKSFELTYQFFG